MPLSTVAKVEDVACSPQEAGPTVFRASLLAKRNVAQRLTVPLRAGRKAVSAISMGLDEPAAFLAEVVRRQRASAGRGG